MMCNYRLSPDRVKIISRHSCTIIARVHSRQGRNVIYLLLINVKHFNNHNSQRKSAQLKFMNAPGRRFSLCFCIFFLLFHFFCTLLIFMWLFASCFMLHGAWNATATEAATTTINLLNEMPVVVNHQCKCCLNNRRQCRKFPGFTVFPFDVFCFPFLF